MSSRRKTSATAMAAVMRSEAAPGAASTPKPASFPCGGVLVNQHLEPVPGNPHSHLLLIGDPSEVRTRRILYGVLRPSYRGWSNTAAEFGRCKLQPVPPAIHDPRAITAARSDVVLPPGAEDRFTCPHTLLLEIDDKRPETRPVLLTYVTITCEPRRLHEQWELVRAYVQIELAGKLATPVILVQHAPHLAGSDNPAHIHLLISPRKLAASGAAGPLGLAGYVDALCGDRGRKLIVDSFTAFEAVWS